MMDIRFTLIIVATVATIFYGLVQYVQKDQHAVVEQPVVQEEAPKVAETKQDEVKQVVQDYIKENPEAIIQSVDAYQEKKQVETIAQIKAAVKLRLAELEGDVTDPRIGPDTASVKIIEFFDYSCTFCRKMHPVVSKIISENPDVQVIFKELPLLGEPSANAAKVGLIANQLSAKDYFKVHDKLMSLKTVFNMEMLPDLATQTGYSADAIKSKLDDEAVIAKLNKNRETAQELGILGVPAFIINGEVIPGSMDYETFKAKVLEAKSGHKEPVLDVKATEEMKKPEAAGN